MVNKADGFVCGQKIGVVLCEKDGRQSYVVLSLVSVSLSQEN